uniref:Spermatogenesis-associated protein 20-like isoform X2 n=1 Tax=Crassostrea virginica TaxID=6565 RepID=A0A8B8BB06_CRAVI|nr:spermatogenesis-associated protein 20-like isoform X2 [Crassostrea virginica]
MSIWLTPELKPLFGGTYFPPDDRYYGRPGFKTVLLTLAEQWKAKKTVIEEQSSVILRTLQEGTSASEASGQSLPDLKACTETLYYQLERSCDQEDGGFAKEPKFPQPVSFNFLIRLYAKCKGSFSDMANSSLEMATFTLLKMAKGGIFDHISKEFHRYSTDAIWHVPHFEKMLYDEAQLLFSYAEAYQEEFAEVVQDIAEYIMRDLLNPATGSKACGASYTNRFSFFLENNILIPAGSRCCPGHIMNDEITAQTMGSLIPTKDTSFVTRITIMELLEQLREETIQRRSTILDFDSPSSLPDRHYHILAEKFIETDDDSHHHRIHRSSHWTISS